jgi:hypothetical protein
LESPRAPDTGPSPGIVICETATGGTAMRHILHSLLLIGLVAAAPAAVAQTPDKPSDKPAQESPREMLEDATRKAMQAFELMLKAIPQYETPEILDNGDIIIRRKPPKPEKPAPSDRAPPKTKT